MTKIVTRESLQQMLTSASPEKQKVIIGRALVALFERQTATEQAANDTRVWNAKGFTGADGRTGSITAKYFLKHRSLLDWQVERWLKPQKNGFARLTKYWKQLNEVAEQKQKQKVAV